MARPPGVLWLRGVLPKPPGVAIVGTRSACEDAVRFTIKLAGRLARAGVAIWSGGAVGVDAAAHGGALEAGGSTVVVMGTGLDRIYPAENRELFDRVLTGGGAWLSPFAEDQFGARWTFLLRNELLAALVDAVIVVQSPLRSGARSTAAAARRMGRRLWVVPAAPWDPRGAGCAEEIRLGAEVFRSAAHVLVELGRPVVELDEKPSFGGDDGGAGEIPEDLDPAERIVVEAVSGQSLHPDDICRTTGLSASQVSGALLTLTLRLVLVQGCDGRVRLAAC